MSIVIQSFLVLSIFEVFFREKIMCGLQGDSFPDFLILKMGEKLIQGISSDPVQYFTLPHLLRRIPLDSLESSGLCRTPDMSHIVTWWFRWSPLE